MEDKEIEDMKNIILSGLPFTSNHYVKEYNNFILPKIICSISGNSKYEVSAYGYKDISVKSLLDKGLSDEAKNVFGVLFHNCLRNKSYMVKFNTEDFFNLTGVSKSNFKKNKKIYTDKLSDLLLELRSFSMSCRIKNKIIGGGLILSFNLDDIKDTIDVIIDPTFIELNDNDEFHLSGDYKKINRSKGTMANILNKLFLTNNYNAWEENKLFLVDIFYSTDLDYYNRNSKTILKRVLDKMVKDDILVSYEFKKLGSAKYLFFKLKKQVPVIADQSNKNVPSDNDFNQEDQPTYPDFDDNEELNIKPTKSNNSDLIDTSLLDDGLPF